MGRNGPARKASASCASVNQSAIKTPAELKEERSRKKPNTSKSAKPASK
ncbi:hypothetical protein JCM11641_002540, partial [Rhodosporidiobolus odoratus]